MGCATMETDVVEGLKKFSLREEELVGVVLDDNDVAKRVHESKLSLFGKIHGSKRANFVGFKNTLQGIWTTKKSILVREVGFNMFQFVFQSEEDKIRVMNNRVWTFDNQYLLLKEWEKYKDEKESEFDSVNLCIQIWNLTNHWISTETGLKIGKLFDEVRDLMIPEFGSIKGRFIKMLVPVKLNKPLLRGSDIELGGNKLWVDFKYENLTGVCYYCGIVGHMERGCQVRKDDLKNNNLNEGQFGDWLKAEDGLFGNKRATIYGERKEHQVSSMQIGGASTSQKEQTIKAVEKPSLYSIPADSLRSGAPLGEITNLRDEVASKARKNMKYRAGIKGKWSELGKSNRTVKL
ncbi:hypothetical protein DH2020_035350 [Rehmannia glutinosa]|uniref:CCHC-type domain-containing protein n=1 Tax=Rehmannia glutinosa TaxID=99300 RepID=A0ABR0V8Y0_REHGL